jgi:hypothetical protein
VQVPLCAYGGIIPGTEVASSSMEDSFPSVRIAGRSSRPLESTVVLDLARSGSASPATDAIVRQSFSELGETLLSTADLESAHFVAVGKGSTQSGRAPLA